MIDRKVHVEFAKSLKKKLELDTGLKLKSRVLKMVGDNPWIVDGDINEDRVEQENEFFSGYVGVMHKVHKKMKK